MKATDAKTLIKMAEGNLGKGLLLKELVSKK